MHERKTKEYFCKYKDCDRSIARNGFSRQWNLQDHIERVHGESTDSLDGDLWEDLGIAIL